MSLKKPTTSLLALLAANLVPLGGVLFFGWDVGLVIVAYWCENLVLGFYNILKMALCRGPNTAHAAKFFMIPFFSLHYGGFCAVHGIFVLLLTGSMGEGPKDVFPSGDAWPGPLVFLQLLVGVIAHLLVHGGVPVIVAGGALLASHGVSFVQNYIRKGEYLKLGVKELMMAPYKRIVLLHVAIIAGGMPVMALGSPLPLLVLLVLGKIALDVKMHLKSHGKVQDAGKETPQNPDES